MKRSLVIANQTLAEPQLDEVIAVRVAAGPVPLPHRGTRALSGPSNTVTTPRWP